MELCGYCGFDRRGPLCGIANPAGCAAAAAPAPRCPYCESDDLVTDGPRVTCVECEANAIEGLWASGRAVRRMRAAIADADSRFEVKS